MKIAYLGSPVLPSRSAHSVHMMKMCSALSDIGHEVYLIGAMRGEESEDVWEYYGVKNSFDIIYVPKPYPNLPIVPEVYLKAGGNVVNSWRSVKEAAKIGPDLVYTRNETTAYLACLKGLYTIYESHVPVPFEQLGGCRNILFKRLLKSERFLLLVVISESIKKYHEYRYNIDPDRILLARDAADPVDPSITPIDFDDDKEVQVGYIGNLYEGRGRGIIQSMVQECGHAHFHVVGGSRDDIEGWKRSIKKDNITFHGFVPPSEIDRYRSSFDVLLAPYQRELRVDGGQNTVRWMSPLKIFEYMATGKPMLASDLPAIREILVDGETALLCDPDDPQEWIDALNRLRDKELRDKIGERAKKEFHERYTWKKRAEMIIHRANELKEGKG